MRVQIRVKFQLIADVCLYDRLTDIQAVILRLTHEGLGDRRNVRLQLDLSIRTDICYFCITQPENIDFPVVSVNITGDISTYDQQSLLIFCQGK